MARVTYGVPVTDLTGSIGGITFQQNLSGSIARIKPKTTVNPSQLQGLKHSILSYLNNLWHTLTPVEVLAWNTFAYGNTKWTPWGKEKTLSGFQWFMSCNLNLAQMSLPYTRTPPPVYTYETVPSFIVTTAVDEIDLNFSSAITFPNHLLCIYASPPIKNTSSKMRRSKFFLETIICDGFDVLNVTYPWATKFNIDMSSFGVTAVCNILFTCILTDLTYGVSGIAVSSMGSYPVIP